MAELDVAAVEGGLPERESEADRRDSERVAIHVLVRDAALGGSFEPFQGNLALGGLFFDALHPPAGQKLEVRFILPGGPDEIHARAEVLRVSRDGPRFGTHLRFVDMELDAELAIARYLQRDGRA
jgi:hypothetical protein